MIFETASIQTMVMLFEKNKQDDDYMLDYRRLHGNQLSDVIDLFNCKETQKTEYLTPIINREFFKGKYLTFSNNDGILDKMRSTPQVTYLKTDELAQGIVFPQDFLNKKGQSILGHHKVGDGIFGLSLAELNNLNLLEKEKTLIKPYFTSDQIFRYYTSEHNAMWMIYTDSSFKDSHSLNSYPHIKRHLDQFVDIITSDNKPYGLHRARNQRFFTGEKIICQRKCVGQPVFSYSDFDCYVTQTFIAIKSSRWNYKALTGILNSKIIAFWLHSKGKMQGANYQVDSEPLQQIPLIVPSDSNQSEIAKQVQRIIELKKNDLSADTSTIEKEIDTIVYHLYNITFDEILAIDPETTISRDEYDNYTMQ
jgi:adenine-specific DNA-methyltransferase